MNRTGSFGWVRFMVSANSTPDIPGSMTSVTRASKGPSLLRRKTANSRGFGHHDVETDARQALLGHQAQVGLVLDQQDATSHRPTGRPHLAFFSSCRRRLLRQGQPDPYGGAGRIRIDIHLAAPFGDQSVDGGHAEPAALAPPLGGEERLEASGQYFGRHARSVVGDRQEAARVPPGAVGARIWLWPRRQGHVDLAFAVHGVAGVDDQVDHDLLELARGRPGPSPVLRGLDTLSSTLGPTRRVSTACRLPSSLPRSTTTAVPSRRVMPSICWVRRAARRAAPSMSATSACCWVSVETSGQELGVADDQGEQVVEIVGDPAGDHAHRFQPLRLDQGSLGSAHLAQIHARHQHGLLVRG